MSRSIWLQRSVKSSRLDYSYCCHNAYLQVILHFCNGVRR